MALQGDELAEMLQDELEESKTAQTMMVEALKSIQMMKCPHTNGCICLYHAKIMARDTLWRIGAAG